MHHSLLGIFELVFCTQCSRARRYKVNHGGRGRPGHNDTLGCSTYVLLYKIFHSVAAGPATLASAFTAFTKPAGLVHEDSRVFLFT